MKAAIYTGVEQIEVRKVERVPPPPGYVLVETKRAGICGSDLHAYFGHWEQPPGRAPGHEVCGIVAELGEGVTGFAVGEKVTMECFAHCGACVFCRTGQYNHCVNRKWFADEGHAGFAEYTTAHVSSLFKLPASMSFEEGALVEPLAVGYRAITQAGADFQDRVAIIGGGTIGLMCLLAAKAAGVKETLITVKYEQQAHLAREMGADHVVNVTETDVPQFVKDLTGGMGMDVVIETVGGGQNFDATLAMVRRRGVVVLVAGYFEPLSVSLAPVVWSEAVITGSNCYAFSGLQTDFQATIDLITAGKADVTRLVTHCFPLDQIAEAFAVAADKRSGAIKVHVCP